MSIESKLIKIVNRHWSKVNLRMAPEAWPAFDHALTGIARECAALAYEDAAEHTKANCSYSANAVWDRPCECDTAADELAEKAAALRGTK